jgi:hypothetical protein
VVDATAASRAGTVVVVVSTVVVAGVVGSGNCAAGFDVVVGAAVVVVVVGAVVVVAVVLVTVGADRGGAMLGGTPVADPTANDHPSTDPGGGAYPAAPDVATRHSAPGSACQYDQYAEAGGVSTHGSSAGLASILHTKPGVFATNATSKPAPVRASMPLEAPPPAQPTTVPPPRFPKSTTTVTPFASEHADARAGVAPTHIVSAPASTGMVIHAGGRRAGAGIRG